MTNLDERYIEELYYRADHLMENEDYAEAKDVLINLLMEDPTYAKAHNMLGWLNTYKLYNLVKAERHFQLAMKYGEGYHAPFTNYAAYLYEANEFDALIIHVDRSRYVPGVDTAYLLQLKGSALEHKRAFFEALDCLEEAKNYTFNLDFYHRLNSDKERIYLKMSRWEKIKLIFRK